jgi:hypothetical protein
MRLRMTTRRWLIAVAIAAVIIATTREAWQRRSARLALVAMHAAKERQAILRLRILMRPPPPPAPLSSLATVTLPPMNLLPVLPTNERQQRAMMAEEWSGNPVWRGRFPRAPSRVNPAEVRRLLDGPVNQAQSEANYHAAMRRKYEEAASRPWRSVAPDPPPP